jgi:AcrR family transcriptional regulator
VPALTRERILETAVAMADRDGFESVTLRGIAQELGVHVTSLYNHVPTRDAVIDGVVELLIEEAQLPSAAVEWEEWVRRFFAATKALAVAHSGAFTALERRPVQGAQAAASFEVALAAFVRAGLDAADAYNAVKATALTALAVGLEQSLAARGSTAETAIGELPPERFPQLRSLDDDVADPESVWAFTLETLVSGLRAQLDARGHAEIR